MGSWNATCAITNNPVFEDEPVYVFLLQAKEKPISRCHPDFLYGLLPFHFEGKYNDYGAVTECNGPMIPVIEKLIRNKLVEFDIDEDNTVEVKKKDFNIDKLFEYDHDRVLFVNQYDYQSQITHIVIKKDVLDVLLQEYEANIYNPNYDHNAEYGGDNVGYIDVDYNYVFNAFKNHIIETKESILNCGDNLSKVMKVLNYESFFTSEEPRYSLLITPRQLLFNFLDAETKTNVTLDEFVHQHVVDFMLNKFMVDSRGVWTPTSGAGSQSSSTTTQRLKASLIVSAANKCDSRWDEEDEEE